MSRLISSALYTEETKGLMAEFTHLHNHSEYSLLDGMTTPEEMASIVSTNGQIAAAITDHGTMGGFIRFQKACKQQGVKPIFGVEAYFVDDVSMDDEANKAERFHLILLAKNDKGLENLFRINNVAWTEQFYYKPRIDFNNLEQYGEGLICLSGCMGSALSQAILNGDEKRADQLLGKFQGIFKDDYYLEVQPHNPPELNAKLIDYGDSYNIPIVGTLDCHFPTKQDAGVEEVLLAIGQNSSMNAAQKRHARDNYDHACGVHDLIEKMDLLYPERRLSFKNLPLYLMDAHEVLEHFNDAGITRLDILENTMEIAEKCNAEIKMNNMFLPSTRRILRLICHLTITSGMCRSLCCSKRGLLVIRSMLIVLKKSLLLLQERISLTTFWSFGILSVGLIVTALPVGLPVVALVDLYCLMFLVLRISIQSSMDFSFFGLSILKETISRISTWISKIVVVMKRKST